MERLQNQLPSPPASKNSAATHLPRARAAAISQERARKGKPPEDNGTFAKVSSRVYRDKRLKVAARFISLIVGYAASKGGFTDEWVPHLADELDVSPRTIERYQVIAAECEMILTIPIRGRGKKNRYVVLPAALPPPRRSPPADPDSEKYDKNVGPTRSESKTSGRPEVLASLSPPCPPSHGESVSGAPLVAAQVARPGASRSAFPPVPSPAAGKNCSPSGAARKIGAQTDAPSATGPP